jgi:putative intracellular protease/amidase/YHS domain-containing protein
MNRRELLKKSLAAGFAAGVPSLSAARLLADDRSNDRAEGRTEDRGFSGSAVDNSPGQRESKPNPLTPPAKGPIPVAFLISDGAVVIDFCGPWEVFQDVHTAKGEGLFHLYTVAETTKPVTASAGLKIVPDYNLETAPAPKVIVIPAQRGESRAMLEWIRKSSRTADVTMSVCTGAYLLAKTGLLSGKAATTHHGAYAEFATQFPDIELKRGARFVEDGNLASAGGLSSGIDLALRVVERYYGRERAQSTADMMEYQGQGWLNPDSNQVYTKVRISTDEHPVCPICQMDADPSLKSVYQGKAYYFCSPDHKEMFDRTPEKFSTTI